MKKKKLAIILACICLLGAAGVYAAPKIKEKIEYATAEIVPGSLEVKHNRALRAIEKDRKKGEDVQPDVEAYAHFLSDLFPSDEEIQYVDGLIGKGFRARDVVEIFEFWQDTQEDLSIIEEAYTYRPPVDGVRYWVDSAFIKLDAAGKTKRHYSNLSEDEVKKHFEEGLSFEELMMADKLSRHGTKEINVIIKDKKEQVSWYEIMDGVYGLVLQEHKKEMAEKYKNITDPNEILACKKLSEQKIMSFEEAMENVKQNKSSVKNLSERKAGKKKKIVTDFISQGIWSEKEQEKGIAKK